MGNVDQVIKEGKSNVDNDLDRIEKMFNRTIWLVGILITVFISGSVISFVTIYNSVSNTAKDAKLSIEKNVDDMSKKITENMSEKIDLNKIIKEIKESEIENITKKLTGELEKSKNEIDKKSSYLASQYDILSNKVKDINNIINSFYNVQNIVKESEVKILTIESSKYSPKITEPFNVNMTIQAPNLKDSNVLKIYIETIMQNIQYSQEAIIKGGNLLNISIPVSPRPVVKNGDDEIKQGQGKYSVEVRVYTPDKKVLLEQSSAFISLND